MTLSLRERFSSKGAQVQRASGVDEPADRRDFLVPATAIDVHELTARFEEMLLLATSGTEVIVTEKNIPRARLVPLASDQARRVTELHNGAIETTEDFDAPLPDEFWSGMP